MDSNGGRLSIVEEFSPAFQDATIDSITINGEQAGLGQVATTVADGNTVTVALSDVPADATVEVTYTVTAVDAAGATHTISGEATSGDDQLTITGDSTVSTADDGTEPTPTPEPEPEVPGGADVVLTDGRTLFQGQTAGYETVGANEEVELRVNEGGNNVGAAEQGILRDQLEANADGAVVVPTAGLAEGNYLIEDSDNNVLATFQVVEQNLDTEFDPDEVRAGGDAPDFTSAYIADSIRNEFTVTVTATRGGEAVSDDTLAQIFQNAPGLDQAAGDDTELTFSGGDQSLDANFSGVPTGDYTFTFDVADTTAESTASITVQPEEAGDVTLAPNTVSQQRGDVAAITVNMSEVTTATVIVGSEASNYRANATITDGDEDGQVVLNFNTYRAGRTNPFSVADGDDDVAFKGQTSLGPNRVLAATDYDISLARGSSVADTNDQPDVRGTLFLTDRSTGDMTIHTAPSTARGNVETAEQVNNAIQDGTITLDDSIAAGDLLVHRVGVSGIYGYLETVEGSTPEAKFANALESGAFTLSITETEASNDDNPNLNPKTLNLTATVEASGLNVVADSSNDAVYVIVRSERARFDREDQQTAVPAEAGDEFEATFGVTEETNLVADTGSGTQSETASATFSVVAPESSFSADAVTVEPSDNQTISGTSTLAAGSVIQVRVDSKDPQNPFVLRDNEVVVQEDGTWTAEFDGFADKPSGVNFTVQIINTDQVIDGTIAEAQPATVSFSAQETEDGSSVTVDSVFLPEGGFVTIHDASLLDGEALASVRGTSDYLSEGTHNNVEVQLDTPIESTQTLIAMPHTDSNDNQEYDFVTSEGSEDAPYVDDEDTNGDGEPTVIATAEVTYSPPTTQTTTTTETTTMQTTTMQTTTMNTPTSTDTATDTPEDGGDSDGGGPGFGIGIAVVALIAAALLALRRQD